MSMSDVDHRPSHAALAALSPAQRSFLRSLPKPELHAHLNGSIPLAVLHDLASTNDLDIESTPALARLHQPLERISDFFDLFPAIYALTATPAALALATRAVLSRFLDPVPDPDDLNATPIPDAAYLELRTTPRTSDHFTRTQYLNIVLDELESYPANRSALIVSLDRRMSHDVAADCIDAAIALKRAGRRVVGVDLCGDPMAGDMDAFALHFSRAKAAGLGITLHIAETVDNPSAETLRLLGFAPDRLGHATFLDAAAKERVRVDKICVELCLSSNLLCKTTSSLDAHHIRYYLEHNHPIAVCTDDPLPFRTSLMAEYALLLASPPVGLGLSPADVTRVADWGMRSRFGQCS